MAEYFGGTATITTLSAVKPGQTDRVRATLKGFNKRSPFKSLSQTRFARFAIVPRTWPEIGGRSPLRSDYLLWIATFDGAQDDYLRELAEDPEACAAWKDCVGWPSAGADPLAVVTYLKRDRVPVGFYFAVPADVTLQEIRNSLELQRTLCRLAAKLPELTAKDLVSEYKREMGV